MNVFSGIRKSSFNQLVKKYFFQESVVCSQNIVIPKRHYNLFISKRYCIRNVPLETSEVKYQSFLVKLSSFPMSELKYSTSNGNQDAPTLSKKDKLKQAVKDYGATVIIFHVTISLMSLGLSYLIISSGVDVASLLEKVGFKSSNDLATGASTFVVAYALHKVFAPVRISITLGCTPFLVRYLRRVGILKPPKPSS